MARHITELNIKTYRGIKDLNITELGDINILVGDNNCGKTSVLEIIKILSQPNDLGGMIGVALSRKITLRLRKFEN